MATLNFATFKDGKRCSKESSLVVHLVVTYKSNSGKKRPTFFRRRVRNPIIRMADSIRLLNIIFLEGVHI